MSNGCSEKPNTEAVVLPTASAAFIDSLAQDTRLLRFTLEKEITLNDHTETTVIPGDQIIWKNEFAILGNKNFSKFEYQPNLSDDYTRCFTMDQDTLIEQSDNSGFKSLYCCLRVKSILRSSTNRIQIHVDEQGIIRSYSSLIEQKLVFEHKKNSLHVKAVLTK